MAERAEFYDHEKEGWFESHKDFEADDETTVTPLDRVRERRDWAISLCLASLTLGGFGLVVKRQVDRTNAEIRAEEFCPGVSDRDVRGTALRIRHHDPDRVAAEAVTERGRNAGFTMFDGELALRDLQNDSTVSEMRETVQQFLEQFGVEIRFAGSTKQFASYRQMPLDRAASLDKLNPEAFRRGTEFLISAFHYVPLELVRTVGLKKILFIDAPDSEVAARVADSGTIEVSLSDFLDAQGPLKEEIYWHEIGHLTDEEICSSAWEVDKEYAALNAPGVEYRGYDAETDEPLPGTFTPYAGSSVTEDKAETFSELMGGLNWALEQAHGSPTLERKMALMLARLEEKVPGITKYLTSF